MVEAVSGLHQHVSISLGQLLQNGEIVAIVDDDAAIREPLRSYFEEHGLPVATRDDHFNRVPGLSVLDWR